MTGLDIREEPHFYYRGLRYFAHRSLEPFPGRALGPRGVGARDRLDAQEATQPLHAAHRHGRRLPEGLPRHRSLSARRQHAARGETALVLRPHDGLAACLPRRAPPPCAALRRRAGSDPPRGHGHDDPLVQLYAAGLPRLDPSHVLPAVGRRLCGRSLQCRLGHPRRPKPGQLLAPHTDAYRRIRLSADVPYDRHRRARGLCEPSREPRNEALRLPAHYQQAPRALSDGSGAHRLVGLLPPRLARLRNPPAARPAGSHADDHPGLYLRPPVEREQYGLHELGESSAASPIPSVFSTPTSGRTTCAATTT